MEASMNRLLVVVAAVVLTFAGCSKSSNPTGSAGGTSPTIPAITLHTAIPDTSSSPYAQSALGQINLANSYTGLTAAFMALPSSNSGNTWTWSYSVGGLTETFTATKLGDGSFTYQWSLNGTGGGHTYSNWVYWQGSSNAAGTSGQWTINGGPTDSSYVTYVWSTDASGNVTATLTTYSSASSISAKIIITANADKSGNIMEYDGPSTLVAKWVWLTTGHGTYYTYPSPGGSTPVGSW
jgi:hypothetical protein